MEQTLATITSRSIEAFRLNPDVSAIRWVTSEDLLAMVARGEFFDYGRGELRAVGLWG